MPRLQNTADFEAPSLPSIGEVIAKKYRVDSVVGTGGMGVVLSATHLELGQSVAIKVLTIPADDARLDEARERFLREGRATAALVSDHVVRVYDVGTLDNGAPFMVMELLRGKDLAVILQENGRLPIEHAADYVRQAAEAIACAHAQGIVHRDLKPSNLFLTSRSDGAPLIKVLDFGISKSMHTELEPVTGDLTGTRSVLGTPFYMSPEQVRDAKKVDFRTDIWSLGLILHELLSGSPAFEGSTLPSVCAAITADPPAALRLKRPEVLVALEAIVLKCLEKDPARRFQAVRDLVTQLIPWSGRPESGSQVPHSDQTARPSPLATEIARLQGSPTVSSPTPGDPGTMASAVLKQSGEQVVDTGRSHALAEAPAPGPASAPFAAPAIQTPAPKRAQAVLAAGLLALITVIALGAVALRGPRGAHPTPAPSNAAPPPGTLHSEPANLSFSVQIDSSPAGAQVYEGDSLLGATPLRLSVQSASVAEAPRTFTIRKAGYAPYTLVQSASPKDTRVLAELALDPGAPAAPAAPAANARSAPKSKKAGDSKAPPPSPKPAGSPSDIFMQR